MPFSRLRGSPSPSCYEGFGTSNLFIGGDRNEIFLVGSREPILWEKALSKSAQDQIFFLMEKEGWKEKRKRSRFRLAPE